MIATTIAAYNRVSRLLVALRIDSADDRSLGVVPG